MLDTVIYIDKLFKELRELYTKKYELDQSQATRNEWNTMEQFASLFTYQVTGLFSQAKKNYDKMAGQNLNDKEVQTKFNAEMAYIIGVYQNLQHMKAFSQQVVSQIDAVKVSIANVQNWIAKSMGNQVTG